MDLKLKCEKVFSNFLYDDFDHSYTHDITKEKLTSVTQFIGKLKPPFDSEYWSCYKAFQKAGYKPYLSDGGFSVNKQLIIPGVTNLDKYNIKEVQEEILKEWKTLNEDGTDRGSFLHNLMEDLDNRDYTKYKEVITTSEDPYYIQLSHLAYKFKQETKEFLYPILKEFTVGDLDYGIAGKLDRIYYNENSGEYEVWDFKTDKKLKYSNKYQKIALFNLDDCEFDKYSLQTSLYKHLIEKNTGIKLGVSYVVHFDKLQNLYNIIECIDYTQLIKNTLDGSHISTLI
jgi:hypothetical protein